ncbi:Dual specificity phosphatase catalytic domain [Trinorchestia longiramus]|nr:Dual specificity phosphatase catalytic domain [Trinorchestia longiramus]
MDGITTTLVLFTPGVLPGLYVGNFRDSKDSSQLREHGITHILAIHDNARKLPCNNDKEHLCILASDSPGQNLTQFFPVCNDFIHSARLKGGSVLIHCLAGMSRSVTVAVIYVMSVTTLNWRDALNAVRGARNVANPNVGFLKQLNEFDAERLTDERRRLKEKYPAYASMAQQDEAVAQEFLASYNLSLRLGETCDGECPVGSVCPRGLCNQRRSSGMFRRSSREKGGRPTPASAIITRNSSESLHSLQEQPSCASLQPDQQPAPITQPTPPPSPSRNRLTNEDEKSPPVSGNPSPQVSPSTSPKHSVAGIGQYASPSSPSRNYGYYTSSSAELTPPGSPYKGRGSQTSGVTVANKSNTVVWHQGTPPSSPKRSQRKQRSALSSFAKTQSSPKLMQHKLVAETESLPSAEKTDAEVATQNLQGAKSKSTLLSANRKSSFPCSVTSRKSNGVLPTQREEKVHLKHATLKMEKEKDTSSRIKIEPSNVVVKVTSPTSPPKKDLNEIKEKVETEQILVAESSVDKRVEPLRHVQNPKLSGMRRHKLNGIQRQSSLPDDGLLRPYDVPASSPSRNERPNIQLQKTPYPADGSTEKSSKEVGSSSSRFAKLDGTMSDNSFNSATLSYATLFYTPRQNLRSLSAPYTPRNNEKTTPQRDFQSIHVIKFPTPISSGGPRARHAIVAQSSFSGRPSSSAILRQRFAALNSHSFELDTRSFTEKTIKINGVAKRAYRINDNFNSALNNAPSLTQLSVSSEAKKEPQLNSKEGKSFSSNNNYKLNTELTKLKYKHPGQNISNGISWKSSDLSSVHEKLPSKVINANRGLSTVSTKRTLERENGTRNELCSAQSKFNANNLQGRNLETDYHKKEKLNHNTLVAHDLSSYCVSDEKNSITSDNISISSASVKNDNNLGTSERQKQHCSSNKKKRPSLDSSASLPVSCSQKVSPPTVNSTPPGKENSTSRPSESSECTPSGRSVKETSRPSAPFHLIQTKSASCSPPTNRMCQASELKCSSRSGSASNVPSWMRQTISRLLASTSQPHLRKANAHRREVSTSGREA